MDNKNLESILTQLTNIVKQQQNTANQPVQSNITLPDILPFLNEDESVDFEESLERFQFSMDCAATNLQDDANVKLLMTKLSPSAFGEYKRSCLPDEITAFNFNETKTRLMKLFARPPSLAIDRYECLKATRKEGEEFSVFVNRLKSLFRKFRYSELNEDQFKCLVLLTSLKSSSEAKLRQHILSRLTTEETKATPTPKFFKIISEEIMTMLKTEAEVKILEQAKPKINAFSQNKPIRKKENSGKPSQNIGNKGKTLPNNCFRCGEMNWAQNCPKLNYVCKKCNQKRHIEKQCDRIQAYNKTERPRIRS